MVMSCWLGVLAGLVWGVGVLVHGHGRLVEPPSRSSMWRYGYDTPKNYADNQQYCGGMTNQWQKNKGKCGVCGDPWEGKRENEAGGKYANGIIVRRYGVGESISIIVEITASHLGYFEFRICPNNNPNKAVTHECLNKHVLPLSDGTGTKYYVTVSRPMMHEIVVDLPAGVECSQCVLQWKYNAGNSWGVDPSGRGCIGCGQQEQFYGCSDIAIGDKYEFDEPFIPKVHEDDSVTTATPPRVHPVPTPTTEQGSSPEDPEVSLDYSNLYDNNIPHYLLGYNTINDLQIVGTLDIERGRGSQAVAQRNNRKSQQPHSELAAALLYLLLSQAEGTTQTTQTSTEAVTKSTSKFRKPQGKESSGKTDVNNYESLKEIPQRRKTKWWNQKWKGFFQKVRSTTSSVQTTTQMTTTTTRLDLADLLKMAARIHSTPLPNGY